MYNSKAYEWTLTYLHYLPETINGMPDDNPEITGMRQFLPVIENDKTGASLFNAGRLSKYDLYTGLDDLNVDRSKEDAVDRRFFIVGAKWSDAIGTRKQADGTVAAADKGWVDFKNSQIIRLDTSNNLRGSIEYVQDDGTGKPAAVAAEDTIQGFVDTARGYLTVMSVSGKLEAIKIRGYVSSEQHTYATQEGFEIEGREIQIPTAQHIEATFPVEWLQDLKAMYNIDGTAYMVDQMSRTIQQRVDMDIIQFLENSYKDTGAAFHKTFDVYPQGQYALTPTEWQSQLRTLVDFLTQEMRQTFKSYDATFTIVGNPLDIMLLPDVSWTFQGAATNVGGVGVNYSIGAVSGIATYKILSSDLIPQGKLKIIGIPQREDYRTFKYYPYTFNVVNNYNNSVNPALPNLMMTKRYTLEEFTPIIGEIDILHNDGTVFNER